MQREYEKAGARDKGGATTRVLRSDVPFVSHKKRSLTGFRRWHRWMGLVMSLCILLVCVTGIYLNHKEMLARILDMAGDSFQAGAPGGPAPGASAVGMSYHLTTSTDLHAQPVTFAEALARARAHRGEIPIQHILVKNEQGTLAYRIKSCEGGEVIVDGKTGALTERRPYKKYGRSSAGRVGPLGYDWGKIVADLHNGRLAGAAGTVLADLAALAIMALTLSGLYLWILPRKPKCQAARASQSPNRVPPFASS